MNNDIFIIIDNSGSMNEIAKPLLTRNLLRGINQLSIVEPDLYAHIRFHFFLWGMPRLSLRRRLLYPFNYEDNGDDYTVGHGHP